MIKVIILAARAVLAKDHPGSAEQRSSVLAPCATEGSGSPSDLGYRNHVGDVASWHRSADGYGSAISARRHYAIRASCVPGRADPLRSHCGAIED